MGFSSSSSSSKSSSRRKAKVISSIASRLFFLLIIFQIPLFRIRCGSGTCTTPIQVTSSQLIASEMLPVDFVKLLLYPSAVLNSLFNGLNIPSYGDLLELYNLAHVKQASVFIDLKNLEILAGSYLSVAGAILGLVKQDRLSLFGMLLLLWGLTKELIREEQTLLQVPSSVYVSPAIFFAILTALMSIKADIRHIIRSFKAHHSAVKASQVYEQLKQRKKQREMKRLEWTVNYVTNSKAPRSTKLRGAHSTSIPT